MISMMMAAETIALSVGITTLTKKQEKNAIMGNPMVNMVLIAVEIVLSKFVEMVLLMKTLEKNVMMVKLILTQMLMLVVKIVDYQHVEME
jgi:hypothetical protein